MLNNLCEYIFLFCCRYLGSGCDQIDLHLTYRLGHTTIGKILRKVCMAIWECLLPESFPEFTEERWKTVADGFQQYCQFPNCLGAIDGKHVRLRKPKMSGSLFYNYKHFFPLFYWQLQIQITTSYTSMLEILERNLTALYFNGLLSTESSKKIH